MCFKTEYGKSTENMPYRAGRNNLRRLLVHYMKGGKSAILSVCKQYEKRHSFWQVKKPLNKSKSFYQITFAILIFYTILFYKKSLLND